MREGTVRLHITPFSPDYLRTILPPTVLDRCDNISYHTIQTFPDKPYGYIDMPAEEATKIKKKLNGSILKGKKIRIENARPKKRSHDEADSGDQDGVSDAKGVEKDTRKTKGTKSGTSTVSGRELSPGRKVKRGWTEVKDGKLRKAKTDRSIPAPSKFTDKEELLFRTKVPPNKKDLVKGRKKDKKDPEVDLVHEFEHATVQPSFLRTGGDRKAAPVAEFVDGKGWVDHEGRVIEQEDSRVSTKRADTNNGLTPGKQTTTRMTRSETAGHVLPKDGTGGAISKTEADEDAEDTSSSGSASSESDEGNSEAQAVGPGSRANGDEDTPKLKGLSIHPLEALFKKPKNPASQDVPKPSLEVETSFSFFDAEDRDGVDEDRRVVPDTPFSSQDGRYRELRSAAPTPDTAHPSRFPSYSSQYSSKYNGEGSEEEDEGDETVTGVQTTPSKPPDTLPAPISEFEKSFWENRGENNRTWKRRRREVNKETRQQVNRASRRPGW